MKKAPSYQLMILEFKKFLKSTGITQQELAKRSKIPLSSIKKILAQGPNSKIDCSINRLIQMIESVGLNFFEFVASIQKKQQEDIFSFTLEQEIFFAKNFDYFLFFHKCFRDFQTPQNAKKQLKLSDKIYWPILKKLESFQLLEVLPGEKLKFKVTGGIKYLADGPLQDVILKKTLKGLSDYLLTGSVPSTLAKTSEELMSGFLRVYFGKVSKLNYMQFLEQLRSLHLQLAAHCISDRKVLPPSELVDVTWGFQLANISAMDLMLGGA